MIVMPSHSAVYVAIPKTASQAISQWLDANRPWVTYDEAERLNDWHANLAEAQSFVDRPLSDFWSFTIVRHPLERLVSLAAWRYPDFNRGPRWWMQKLLDEASPEDRLMIPQTHFTTGVQTIFRFEDLPAAITHIKARLALEGAPQTVNASSHPNWQACYDSETLARAIDLYGADMQALGYESF